MGKRPADAYGKGMDATQLRHARAIAMSLGFPESAYLARIEHFVARPDEVPVLRAPETRQGELAAEFEALRSDLGALETVDALIAAAQNLEPVLARLEALRERVTPDAAELFAFQHARVLRRPLTPS